MIKKVLVGGALLFMAVVVGAAVNYRFRNLEKKTLNEGARRGAPGQFIRVTNGTVHYELAGPDNGRTVVLIHGFGVPYTLWDRTFPALVSAGFRVLRYDLFGRGFSDRPMVNYDADLFDAQLVDLLNALHLYGPIDLAGASMGAPIAAAFACRHPERVRTVTLLDPGYTRGMKIPFTIRAPFFGEYWMAVRIAPRLPALQLDDFVHPERFADWPDRCGPQMEYRGFRRALLSTMRHYFTVDWAKFYECLGKENVPVLAMWGKADVWMPYWLSNDLRVAIPRMEFLPIEDGGHLAFVEHSEIANPALVRFLGAH